MVYHYDMKPRNGGRGSR